MRAYRSYTTEPFPQLAVGKKQKKGLHRVIRKTARHLHIEEFIFDNYHPRTKRGIDATLHSHGVPARRVALEIVAGILLAGPAISNHAFRMIALASKKKRDRCLAEKLLDIARRSIRRKTYGLSKWFYRTISDLRPLCPADPGGLVHALSYVNKLWRHKMEKMLHLARKLPQALLGCWYTAHS